MKREEGEERGPHPRPLPLARGGESELGEPVADSVANTLPPKRGEGLGIRHACVPGMGASPSPTGVRASASHTIAIGLGSNLGDREANLAFGREELVQRGVRWTALSSLYETEPVGPVADQPPFLNQVAVGETNLPPQTLLEICLFLEQERGRVRTQHWGPRTLDLDILLYGDEVIRQPNLTVPHPEIANRAFVLVPLSEAMSEGQQIPGISGQTISELLAAVTGREGVRLWRSSDTK